MAKLPAISGAEAVRRFERAGGAWTGKRAATSSS